MSYLKDKRDAMLSMNFRGGRLPNEFQEVDYIESSGTQYIDTGLNTLSYGTSFILEEDIICNFFNGYQGANGILQFRVQNYYFYNKSEFDARQRNYLSVEGRYENNKTLNSLKVNDELCISQYWNTKYGGPILLFAMGHINQVYSGSIKPCIMYSAKVTIDNNLERDFIPCYRKSDEEIGMYDLVTKSFFTNQGTGTFTKGPDI